MDFEVSGNVVDVFAKRVDGATVVVRGGRIADIRPDGKTHATFLMPGFVDSHIHIESSMLPPAEFARLAVVHGTVATVSDPHEIANVLGEAGVRHMIDSGRRVPFHFCFGAPACVPATQFETAGATLDAHAVTRLLEDPQIGYLSEVMNFPDVIRGEPQVMAKIAAAKRLGKPIDGHAPGLRGADCRAYFAAGVQTDHECFTYEEAKEKIEYGAKILIRQGSAARNFEALWPLINEHPDRVMLCTDDKHPDALVHGHINTLASRAVDRGADLFNVIRAACVNPVEHYRLPVGLLRIGDPADLIEVDSLKTFRVIRSWIKGQLVALLGPSMERETATLINNFTATYKSVPDFAIPARGDSIHVITTADGQLITGLAVVPAKIDAGHAVCDTSRDILKIAVINRYHDAPPALAFIRGFGLNRGAIASSVAHDSHNVVAVGTNDADLCAAVNSVISQRGGLAVVRGNESIVLPLPIAGLMSDQPGESVARKYAAIDQAAKSLGSTLAAPFMTLSFMALLVIPELKLSDRGLFDARSWRFTELFPSPPTHSPRHAT